MIDVIIEYGPGQSSCVHEISVDGENWTIVNLAKYRNGRPTSVYTCATEGGPATFRGSVDDDVTLVRVRQVEEFWRGSVSVVIKAGSGHQGATFSMPGQLLAVSTRPPYVIKEETTIEEMISELDMSQIYRDYFKGKPYAELDNDGNVVIRNNN